MFRKIAIFAAFAAIGPCFSATSRAQYGGVQVQIGGYGPGVQWGGYGNGYDNNHYSGFGNSYRYGNGYNNSYYSGYGNSYRYGNGYQLGYGSYSQPNGVYYSSGNYGGFRYSSSPTISYGIASPRYYTTPVRRFSARRFR